MVLFGRVFAVRRQVPFTLRDRHGPRRHSVSAGILSMNKFILPSATGFSIDHAGHPSSLTAHNSDAFQEAVRQGFILVSPIAAGIPVVGTVLNGCINTLLAVWNGINKKNQNKEIATRLAKDLYNLLINMSAMDNTASVQNRQELALKLEAILERLKRLPVNSFLHNARTAEALLDCIAEVNSHIMHYIALACMRTEQNMDRLLVTFSDNHEKLPSSVKQGVVFVMDVTGREFKVLPDQCQSRRQFIRVLECYFGDTERDRVMRNFMGRGAYDLHIETESGIARLDGWARIQAGTRVVMSAVFELKYYRGQYICPRCKTWNASKKENDGWNNW